MNKIKEKKPHDLAKYVRYNKKWEKYPAFQEWVAPMVGNDQSAFCKVCCRPLYPSRKDLQKHARTKKHRLNYAKNLSFKEYITAPTNSTMHNFPELNTESDTFIKCETMETSLSEITAPPSSSPNEKQSLTIKLFPSDKGDDDNLPLLDESFSIPEEVSGMTDIMQIPLESLQSQPLYRDWLMIGENDASCIACKASFKSNQIQIYKHSIGKIHLQKCAKKSYQTATCENSISCDILDSPMKFSPQITYGKEIVIDLRSDSVTIPSNHMKDVMFKSNFSSNQTTELEDKVANMLKKDEGLLFPSGTMANIAAVLTHCWKRDAEVVLGVSSQLNIESSAALVKLCSIPVRTIKNNRNGSFCLEALKQIINNDDGSPMSLICVESPLYRLGGKAIPIEWMEKVGKFCEENNCVLHMDGSRLLNASISCGLNPDVIIQSCDSSTFCLNKGLGTPIGCILVGSHPFINRAKKIRDMLGGSLQQTDAFAAAGLLALREALPKLSQDHANARKIAQSIKDMHSSAIFVELEDVQTNIIHIHTDNVRVTPTSFCQRLSKVTNDEILILGGVKVVVLVAVVDERTVQLVTHLDLTSFHVDLVIKKIVLTIKEYDNSISMFY